MAHGFTDMSIADAKKELAALAHPEKHLDWAGRPYMSDESPERRNLYKANLRRIIARGAKGVHHQKYCSMCRGPHVPRSH